MNDIQDLQAWYAQYCDGEWEHFCGIRIDTLDNPGWSLTVDLEDTHCQDQEFKTVSVEKDESNWFYCEIKQGQFKGAGGPHNLSDLIKIFLTWAEHCQEAAEASAAHAPKTEETKENSFLQRLKDRFKGA